MLHRFCHPDLGTGTYFSKGVYTSKYPPPPRLWGREILRKKVKRREKRANVKEEEKNLKIMP
jgi:hypothetical protein